MHKAGFVNIIGSPNVGKSTLMNVLVGEKLSAITYKAQTTRHRILGIVSGEDFQIVYSDTPGIIKPGYMLHERMMTDVKSAFSDADIILFVTDIHEEKIKDERIIEKLKMTQTPVLLLLNKVDLADPKKTEERAAFWKSLVENAEIIPISALKKFNINAVLNKVMRLLPDSPPFFPKDQLTDKSQRFFISEIIREKIFQNYKKEIPYSSTVMIESFKESDKIVHVRAEITVERDTQKGIIIGHRGESLKKVGIQARKDIEEFLQKKIYLELFVKVSKDWRNKTNQLDRKSVV